MDILFDRETMRVVGTGRDPLPYELVIKGVDPARVTKQVPYTDQVPKRSEDGETIYFLPQPDREIVEEQARMEETTEDTGVPVMVVEVRKEPLLDDAGEQVSYIPTTRGETTEDTGDPVWVYEETEEGGQQQVQKVDDLGTPLFWGQVPNPAGESARIYCTVATEFEVQKKDAEGALLFWKEVVDELNTYEPQAPLEILQTDERYTEDLLPATEEVTRYRTTRFTEEPELFTYADIEEAKQSQLVASTLCSKGVLFERMDHVGLFQPGANIGVDFISLPGGAEALTEPLLLPQLSKDIRVHLEAAEGILVSVSADDGNTFVDIPDLTFSTADEIGTVILKFKNTASRIGDIHSFGLLVL